MNIQVMNRSPDSSITAKAMTPTTHTPEQAGNMKVALVVCATLFFGVLNSSGVSVILPEMSEAFSVNAGQLSWVMSGYLLTYGIAIPFYGRLADKIGTRPLFLLGIVLFSAGSIACLVAPSFETMLAARVLQAGGGAAFPGLGMAIASRAFPEHKRGIVLGIISATIGVGSAVGPLVAGIMTDLLHWRALFGLSALVILVFWFAWKELPDDEALSDGALDVVGGLFMGMGVTGLLYAVSQSSQTGWSDPTVLAALVISAAGLIGLVLRQRTFSTPFIPNELVGNIRYLRLVTLAFLAAAVNLAALIGFPFMLATQNELASLQIGLVMLPGAIATVVCGVLAGRWVDRVGPRLPTRLGVGIMLVTMTALSLLAGGPVTTMAILAGLLGAGFAFLNTPIAAIISVMVRPSSLASALSINTMMFFVGGSLGAAMFASIVSSEASTLTAWNPFYTGQAIGYSNAFSLLTLAVILALALVLPLPTRKMVDADKSKESHHKNWTPDCAAAWSPELEDTCTRKRTSI
jgi:DHA2 family metal-tetracycline-proton antiporter-like MFS transporter